LTVIKEAVTYLLISIVEGMTE